MSSEPQWYVAVGGKQQGPLPLAKLKRAAETGKLPDAALVKRNDWADWRPWRDVPILLPQPTEPEPEPDPPVEFAAFTPGPAASPFAGGFSDVAGSTPATAVPTYTREPEDEPPRSTGDRGTAADYLAFRRMITPVAIQVIFWLGVGAIGLYGLFWLVTSGMAMFSGEAAGIAVGLGMLLGALVTCVVSIIALRIYCEIVAVLFRSYELLGEISRKLDRR